MEEECWSCIVRHEGVEKSVAVIVCKGDTHALAQMRRDPRLLRDVGEGPVAIIAVQRVMKRSVILGMTVGPHSVPQQAYRIFVYLPAAVIHHEQVKQAIVVVVEPTRPDRPHFLAIHPGTAQPSFRGYVCKCTIPVIVKQLVTVDVRKKYARPAVVVKVAHSNAHSVARASDPGTLGDVGKCAVVIISI